MNIDHNLFLPLLIYTKVHIHLLSILPCPCGEYLPLDPVAPSLQKHALPPRQEGGPSTHATPHTWTE